MDTSFASQRRPGRRTGARIGPVVTLALAVFVASAACERGPREEARPATLIVARPVSKLPGLDSSAAAWRQAPVMTVALTPQDLVEPKLAIPGVASVAVQALHDGRELALRLRWTDATRDVLGGPGRFSDAAAIELPMGDADPPDPAMGSHGKAVQIVYWKAAWQETGDPVAALRPRMHVDHYPFEAAAPEHRATLARLYAPARGAHNPGLTRPEGSPVQDLFAEGAGTLTAAGSGASAGRSTGRADWREGAWTLVLVRPLAPASEPGTSAPQARLAPGQRASAAFAIWDGSAGHVGAKKMRSVWVPLHLEVTP
jgi:hypothetical protein